VHVFLKCLCVITFGVIDVLRDCLDVVVVRVVAFVIGL
jgi:hypothetical protein